VVLPGGAAPLQRRRFRRMLISARMNIPALLYALSLCISLFALFLMLGVRLLRRQDIHTYLREQERARFERKAATRQRTGSGCSVASELPPSY
jgi:hypothetical protein